MMSRSRFVVGTVNGKTVAYIVDKSDEKDRSTSAHGPGEPSRDDPPRPSTSTSINHRELEEAARINGSVTLSQKQLEDLLALLERHRHGDSPFVAHPPRTHEAWLSSTSSCDSRDLSLPSTPGPGSAGGDASSRSPASANILLEQTSGVGGAGYATVKASFSHIPSYDGATFEIPTKDQGLNPARYYGGGAEVDKQSLIVSSQSEPASLGHKTNMKSPLSLLEQKRLQWAKERAELEGLCTPWGRNPEHEAIRAGSKMAPSLTVDTSTPCSLPIISRDSPISPLGYSSDREWRGGNIGPSVVEYGITSPFPPPLTSPAPSSEQDGGVSRSRSESRELLTVPVALGGSKSPDEPASGGVSLSSSNGNIVNGHKNVRFTARTPGEGEEHSDPEGRPRWGDKGVGVGHLWEPSSEPTARLPDPHPPTSSSPGAYPAWLERSLSRMGPSPDLSIKSVGRMGSSPDPSVKNLNRLGPSPAPSDGAESRNFLRGQNVPLDPIELEEREKRRQKAIEHQKAVKEQLEEREKKRKEERELRLTLERQEEERVRREQELERARMEQERRREQEIKAANEAKKAGQVKTEDKPANRHSRAIKPGPRRVREPDKPINLSPRILTQRSRPEFGEAELDARSQRSSYREFGGDFVNDFGGDFVNGGQGYGATRGLQELHLGARNGHAVSDVSEGPASMVMLGQEVTVLLAPELEERLLNSRAARDQSTQTDSAPLKNTRKSRQPRSITERPRWGAHHSTQRYVKQSDKDVYRQRGTSLPTPPRCTTQAQQQNKSQHHQHVQTPGGGVPRTIRTASRATVESTEESDRSPVCLARRRATISSQSPVRRFHMRHSSDEDDMDGDSPLPFRKLTPSCWGSGREAQVWSNPQAVLPPRLQSPAPLLELQRPQSFDIFNPPVRNTCSPPVPAVAKKLEKQPELFMQHVPRRESRHRPVRSPPVPAVMRRLQESGGNLEERAISQLPNIGEVAGNKSAPPAFHTLQPESNPGLLPVIKPREASSAYIVPAHEDILSQLSTLRRALQTKQHEWELRSETPYSDS